MSAARDLRRFAVTAERAAGCRCRPHVETATVVLPDGERSIGVAVSHERWCRRWVPDGVVVPHLVGLGEP
jgi:hypothetical protein